MKTLNTLTTYRHKWADVILAHIDGKAIQYKNLEELNPKWRDTRTISGVDEKHLEWRIKPEPPIKLTLGEVANKTWTKEYFQNDAWQLVANAVIEAYKAEQ